MCGVEKEAGSHCLAGLAADSGGEADMSHIIVAFSKRENAANIRNILMRSGMDVSAVCLTGAAVLQNADTWNEGIVICGYRMQDMQYTRLRELLPEQFEMLLAAPPDRWVGTELPDGVVGLPMPIKVHDLVSSVEMMIEAMERRRRKRRRKEKERSAGDKAVVDRAKAVLMERNNMSEEDAHRYLQKCSMESGTNMVETAQMVLTIMD
jgi:response regulator NasT